MMRFLITLIFLSDAFISDLSKNIRFSSKNVLIISFLLFAVYSTNVNGLDCDLNSNCPSNTLCDIEDGECLLVLDQSCANSSFCVNNLECISGKCACQLTEFYDSETGYCVDEVELGGACESDDECESNQACSTVGSVTNVCLRDKGEPCGSSDECVNLLSCLGGKCSCIEPYYEYDDSTSNCEVNTTLLPVFKNLDATCALDTECGTSALACDTSLLGDQTKTCKADYGQICISSTDCVSNLVCNRFRCKCDSDKFYDGDDCIQKKEFGENCDGNNECSGNLLCNIYSYSNQKAYICLLPFGHSCESDNECTNNLNCLPQSKKCGCLNGYFNEKNNVCVRKSGNFGSKCNPKFFGYQCGSGLICSRIGQYTGVCLSEPGEGCANDYDCANLLHCQLDGTCGCDATSSSNSAVDPFTGHEQDVEYYNPKTQSCELVREKQENELCLLSEGLNACDNFTLNCDRETNKCKRDYFAACLRDSDCRTGLKCIDQFCDCPKGKFSNQFSIEYAPCLDYEKYEQSCSEFYQCAGSLVCSLYEGSSQKPYTCLKHYGAMCEASYECANSLTCINGECSCQATEFYQSDVHDCVTKGTFGQSCKADNECETGLGCDLQPVGPQTYRCAFLKDDDCTTDADCVNNLYCDEDGGEDSAECECDIEDTYDNVNKVCKSN